MSDATKKPCGPHTDLVRNEGVRVARCACGTLHLHLQRSGVSVQLSESQFDELAQAVAATAAIRVAEARGTAPRGTGGVAIEPSGAFIGVKKPSMN